MNVYNTSLLPRCRYIYVQLSTCFWPLNCLRATKYRALTCVHKDTSSENFFILFIWTLIVRGQEQLCLHLSSLTCFFIISLCGNTRLVLVCSMSTISCVFESNTHSWIGAYCGISRSAKIRCVCLNSTATVIRQIVYSGQSRCSDIFKTLFIKFTREPLKYYMCEVKQRSL